MTMNSDEAKVEAPTGKKVYCEKCGWTGTDHGLLPPNAACPRCKRIFSVTEYTGDAPPVTTRSLFSFSTALSALKDGRRVRRHAWPAGEFVTLQKGYPHGIAINKNTAEATGIPEGEIRRFNPYLMRHWSAQGGSFSPWQPDVGDLLVEDWEVLS